MEQSHNNDTFKEIWEVLMAAENVLIPLHLSPDPDSYGSALASALLLTNLGKKVEIISVDDIPDLENLNDTFPVTIEDVANKNINENVLILCQDINFPFRVSENNDFTFPDTNVVINIDHHQDNDFFGNLNYIDSDAQSTAVILSQLFDSVGVTLTYDIALALFYGIVTDTGWFSYSVQPKVFEQAAKLIAHGIDTRYVSYDLKRVSLKRMQFQGELSSRIEVDTDLAFAYILVPYELLEELGVAGDRTVTSVSAISHGFKYITEPKIDFGIVIKESEPGVFKASLRTQESGDYNVAELASRVTKRGGGHKMAAGFKMEAENILDVIEKVKQVAREIKDEQS